MPRRLAECFRQHGKRQRDCQVSVVLNTDSHTAYEVGGLYGVVILIDAVDGSWQSFDLNDSTDEPAEEWQALRDELLVGRKEHA